jgi:hypothetical protein
VPLPDASTVQSLLTMDPRVKYYAQRRLAEAGICVAICQALAAQRLPHHTLDVQLDFSGREVRTTWVNGYLPRFKAAWEGARPVAWMLDRNGRTVITETEVWFPEALQAEIKAVTADVAGNLYASVRVFSKEKVGTGAISRLSPTGGPMLVIRTDDFLATNLAVTRSGQIWAFGLPILLQPKRTTTEEYMTIERFDSGGRLIARMVPRSSFGPNAIPNHNLGGGHPRFWGTTTRVGLYTPVTGRWLEFDAETGRILLDMDASPPAGTDGVKATLVELAMTDSDNRVYAFFTYAFPDQAHPRGLYELDRASGKWTRIPDRGPSEEYRGLFGADGDDLIFRAGTKTFGWVPAAKLREASHDVKAPQ